MTYKRLTKAKAENLHLIILLLVKPSSTIPKHKVGLDLLVCNSVYGHSKENRSVVEVVSGKKGPSWTFQSLQV